MYTKDNKSASHPSIAVFSQEMIDTFEGMKSDPQIALDYLIDLGNTLPPFPSIARKEENLVSGCLARVWIDSHYEKGRLFLQGDSDAMITKGLLALLIFIFSAQPIGDIIANDFSFLMKIPLPQWLGRQRRAGMASMVQRIRTLAHHYQKQAELHSAW